MRPEQRKKIVRDVERGKTPFIPSNMSREEYEQAIQSLRNPTPESAAEAKAAWDDFIEATDGKAELERRAKERREEEAEKRKQKDPHKQISTGWDEGTTDAWMNEPIQRNLRRPTPPHPEGGKKHPSPWDEQSKWEAVVLTWNDCQTLGYDEEDTAEMLYGTVASIMDGSYEPPD
jgi:hypothetical protein